MENLSSTENSAKSIFFAALDIENPAARTDYVDEACHLDASLQKEVNRLLIAHRDSEDHRLVGAFQVLNPQLGEKETSGDVGTEETSVMSDISSHPVVDRYKILKEIGRGGMGTVYLAAQLEPVKRKVALKVINPGMDSRDVIARFEAERQALAMMDHPSIARVFDGGTTEQGRPYFVMELVRGIPITEYCDKHRLSLESRLNLFITLCQAVHHAHQKGIIHRDLKPSNVQITNHDGQPVVKVIDFGVAKALSHDLTDKTLFTHFAQLVGTPLYMSPEQADQHGLDIDIRSDVYSLGVLLYELLTGTTPFNREELSKLSIDEVRRIICDVDPLRPSTRLSTLKGSDDSTLPVQQREIFDRRKMTSTIRGDLDLIVMKALEKERNRRYESASSLAQDVSRYLNNEPIEAIPPTLFTKLAKWSRRHAEIAWTIAIGFIVISLTIAVWLGGHIAFQAAVTRQLQQDLEEVNAAIDSNQEILARQLLSASSSTASQLGAAGEQFRKEIELLSNELDRYQQFTKLYQKARRDRSSGPSELAEEAIRLYGVLDDSKWLASLQSKNLPKGYIDQLIPQVYELLICISHYEVLWMEPHGQTAAQKLKTISKARSMLAIADKLHPPTKGYYWVLASCYQRLGDLTDGDVRTHHDQEAIRLRALAKQTAPQDAAELFYIVRDRRWGAAASWVRPPFADPLSDEGILAAYRDMRRIDRTYYNAIFFEGIQLDEMGRHAEAAQAYSGCLMALPDDLVALSNRGNALVKMGNVDEGLRDQEQSILEARSRLDATTDASDQIVLLATLLEEYAISLRVAGRENDVLAAIQEASDLLEQLEASNPSAGRDRLNLKKLREAIEQLDVHSPKIEEEE
ncbi:serine/threonine-protein kinase [Bythopirellula polymerisocia]|nr:serine/threonine-protein kinase [Bythopirellula polymerisocia]